MAHSILIKRLHKKYRPLWRPSWQALARLIPLLERAGLRFFYRIDPRLAFPACEIQSLTIQQDQVEISLNFMGLQGVSTPLPIHYSELILQDDPDESSLNEFYNFFNHQFFRHLLAIQQKYAYLPQSQGDFEDVLSLNILSFAGLHPSFFRQQEDYVRILPFMNLLLGKQLSQSSWCQLIQGYFHCEQVWLKQWMPLKIKIPESAQNRLGNTIHLGQMGSLGEYVTQAKNHVEVHLQIHYLHGFLPHQFEFKSLTRLLHWLTPTPITFSIVLHVSRGNSIVFSPEVELYLGWNTLIHHDRHPEMILYGLHV